MILNRDKQRFESRSSRMVNIGNVVQKVRAALKQMVQLEGGEVLILFSIVTAGGRERE